MNSISNYQYIPVRNEVYRINNDKMGQKIDKFLLLMWKNWLLQYRKPIQTLVEVIAPVSFSVLLVVIRSLVDPERHESVIYQPFCTLPIPSNSEYNFLTSICPVFNETFSLGSPRLIESGPANSKSSMFSNFTLLYSPRNDELDSVMNFFYIAFNNVTGMNSATDMENIFIHETGQSIFAGIQFDKFEHGLENIRVSIRFPGETRMKVDSLRFNNWRTNLIFPLFQEPGPRASDRTTGGSPSYFQEGFLAVQHFLTVALILKKRNYTWEKVNNIFSQDNFEEKKQLLQGIPIINMRRFPHSEWYEDMLLTALKSLLGIIIMMSFVYSCINTVKVITTEKERQLKEAMKIMGLPNWLHWTSWFVKSFIFLFISITLMVILMKVQWYPNTNHTVFTHADPTVMLFFLTFYISATITFCFAISVFFSKANTAATIAGLAWFLSYFPFMFLQQKYDTLGLGTKLMASLGANSAMAFGFQIMLMYEGTGEGIQWNNILTPNSPDDSLTLGLILVMLLVDTFLYLLIALYVEAVFPGEYGVPLPWNFPFTITYWFGQPRYTGVESKSSVEAYNSEYFEKEPKHLNVGIEIKELRKVFGSKTAVRNLSLNMYEDQITVLLGHNGAGKTTTMSMLTGMFTPSSGTAKINGYDIRHDMNGVRQSLGLCPQHNIIFDDMTVAEHLYFFSKLKGLNKSRIILEIDKYVDLLELRDKRNAKSSTLSGGMKRKLCVGMALCGNSKVVMLDEPTAGMDPSARRALWTLLQSQKSGRTILLTTHFMDEADLLGDRIAIMAGGELQCCGSSFFLKKKYGAGYSLIMDKSRECDASQVTQLLRKHIPDIEIYSNVGSELTYLLVENQSSVFEALLRDLETSCARLGIRSYGISLTTLEEVFMKVGADHGQEDMYDDVNGVERSIKTNFESNGDSRVNFGLQRSYTTNMEIIGNQFRAMFMKKYISTVRSWILLLIQVIMPVMFLIIAIAVLRNQNRTGNLPAMPLNLDKFDDTVSLMALNKDSNLSNEFFRSYKSIMDDHHYHSVNSTDIKSDILKLTSDTPNRVRRHYIVGASFGVYSDFLQIPNITAWFNNDPYHSPGITLSLVLNSIYHKMFPGSNIEFINAPFPYSIDTQVNQIFNGQTMGFQLVFNIAFSMAFVSSFYVMFVVKENASKSKHLQFVSGVRVIVFWLTCAICDMVTYIFTISILIIALVSFQESGFSTFEQISRLFLILFCFGWSFIPMIYITGYFFDVPSTGFTRMTLFSIFTGVAAFLVVQILNTDGLNLEYIGNALHWLFLLVPHYCLATGISESYKTFAYDNVCRLLRDTCERYHIDMDKCLANKSEKIINICRDSDNDYYKWEAPGIGRNLVYSFTVGTGLFVILLFIEYEVFSKVIYYISQKYFATYPIDVHDEDSDVREEKIKIRDATESTIHANYILAVRDLTKYYKKFLAVNGLCLGVKKYECFGLLGVNGAGKTTTFKMMTGDVKISYGDGWVNGFSIKNQLKEVQKMIGYCPQFDALLDDMTARETLIMFALLRGIPYCDTNVTAEYLAKEFDFSRHLHKKVKQLSGGNKRKLSTAIALIGDPPVLYLDEPTTGMDPATKRYLWNAICKIRDNGKCIILTSHSMEECEALCTRLAIMVNGNFKCLGSTQHLKNKFAEGYTLMIKVKKSSEMIGIDHSYTQEIERFIQENFPGSQLRERHQELLTYYITDKTVPWSKMFGVLENGKRSDLNIEDYSIGQSSLEQVFLTFTKHQN